MNSPKYFGNESELLPKNLPSLKNTFLFEMITNEKYGSPFSFNILRLAKNGEVVKQQHAEQHAVYVAEGSCRLLLNNEYVDLEAGGYAYIPPNMIHEFRTDGNTEAKILIIKL